MMLDKIKSAVSGGDKPNLQKAKIVYDSAAGMGSIECQFNPATLSITKRVGWHAVYPSDSETDTQADLNAPEMVFAGGSPAEFSLDLIFDTTILDNQDVRGYTNQLLSLTLMGGGDPSCKEDDPPLVQFVWGEFMLFEAVITMVQIHYTLFLPSGIPVRARANVHFIQAYDSDGSQDAQNPTSRTDPRKMHRVQQGDRLDFLAFQEYGRSDMWREIAEANHLDNPLDIQAGQTLILPPHS
jgi:hypothetical protein